MLMQFLVDSPTVGGWTVPPTVAEHCRHPEKQRGGPMKDEDFYW